MEFTDKKIKEGLQNIGGVIGMDKNASKEMREFILSKIHEDRRGRSESSESEVVFKDKIRVVRDWMGLNWVSVRIATIVMIVLSVFGGSITTVSASLQSLPGDFLFPVKRTAEKIQVALKTDENSRTKLKMEFAGRRLEEAKTIMKSKNTEPEKEAKVALAIENFKMQIDNIKEDLANSETRDAGETAKMVAEKADEYQKTINRAIQDMPAVKENAEIATNTILELNAEAGKIATIINIEEHAATGSLFKEGGIKKSAESIVKNAITVTKKVEAPEDSTESFKVELQMIEDGNPDSIQF